MKYNDLSKESSGYVLLWNGALLTFLTVLVIGTRGCNVNSTNISISFTIQNDEWTYTYLLSTYNVRNGGKIVVNTEKNTFVCYFALHQQKCTFVPWMDFKIYISVKCLVQKCQKTILSSVRQWIHKHFMWPLSAREHFKPLNALDAWFLSLLLCCFFRTAHFEWFCLHRNDFIMQKFREIDGNCLSHYSCCHK